MIQLDESAKLLSSYGVALTFRDEAGELMIPDSVAWTLTDKDGDVINGLENVSVDFVELGTTCKVVLKGADLQAHPSGEGRILQVSATYTSTLGEELPLTEWIHFTVGQ